MGKDFGKILKKYKWLKKTALFLRAYGRFWTVCALVLLFNVLFCWINTGEKQRQIRELRERYAAERRKIPVSAQGNETMQKYIQTKEALQLFRKKLPEENAFRSIEDKLRGMAEKNGLSGDPAELRPENISEMLLLRYVCTLRISGPYAGLRQFLADVQNAPELLCIENFSIRSSLKKGNAEMELSLSTYFRGSMRIQPLSSQAP